MIQGASIEVILDSFSILVIYLLSLIEFNFLKLAESKMIKLTEQISSIMETSAYR